MSFGGLEAGGEASPPTQGGNRDPSGSCFTVMVLYLIEGSICQGEDIFGTKNWASKEMTRHFLFDSDIFHYKQK